MSNTTVDHDILKSPHMITRWYCFKPSARGPIECTGVEKKIASFRKDGKKKAI